MMKFLFSSWFHLKNERLVLIRLAEIVLFSYLDLKLLRRQTERCAQMDIRCTTAPSGIKKRTGPLVLLNHAYGRLIWFMRSDQSKTCELHTR